MLKPNAPSDFRTRSSLESNAKRAVDNFHFNLEEEVGSHGWFYFAFGRGLWPMRGMRGGELTARRRPRPARLACGSRPGKIGWSSSYRILSASWARRAKLVSLSRFSPPPDSAFEFVQDRPFVAMCVQPSAVELRVIQYMVLYCLTPPRFRRYSSSNLCRQVELCARQGGVSVRGLVSGGAGIQPVNSGADQQTDAEFDLRYEWGPKAARLAADRHRFHQGV
jgi:hypothetical protein